MRGAPTVFRSHWALRKDHPRVCGEHTVERAGGTEDRGSSPRMRGAPGRSGRLGIYRRIIPAYAGSPRRHAHKAAIEMDHPRVCGEHLLMMA